MRWVVCAVCVAAIAAPTALAKGRFSVALGDSTPRVGQPFAVYVRTGWLVPSNDWLMVPPPSAWMPWVHVHR